MLEYLYMPKPKQFCTVVGCDKPRTGHGLCRTHYMRWRRHGDPLATPRFDPLAQRFWRYVAKTDTCWNWTGAISSGYGVFVVDQRPTKAVRSHRYSYELAHGPIPDGLTIDHLCRNKRCVNPDHLEAVTMRVNVLRNSGPSARNAIATHCIHGHPFDAENTYIKPDGRRRCRACERDRMRAKRFQLRSASN